MLQTDALHELYWEQCGNPQGVPVVLLPGGPGAGASPVHRRFFAPDHSRVVIFDQRGAGRSRAIAGGSGGARGGRTERGAAVRDPPTEPRALPGRVAAARAAGVERMVIDDDDHFSANRVRGSRSLVSWLGRRCPAW